MIDHLSLYVGGAGVLAVSAVAASFFVLQTRQRSEGANQMHEDATAVLPSEKLIPEALAITQAPASELFFGQTEYVPLITVTWSDSPAISRDAQEIEPGLSHKGRLNALAQTLPTVFDQMPLRSGTWMRVVVNGELERGADGLLLPFVRDSRGQVTHLARLDPGRAAALAANAAAFWQIASVIVAQKHLADISAKLSRIESKLEKVLGFLEDDRRSKITASLAYLQQVTACIKMGEVLPAVANEVEAIERDLLGVQHHILSSYKRSIQDVSKYQDAQVFGSLEAFHKLTQFLEEFQNLNEVWMLSEDVRVLNARLLVALSPSRILSRERALSIRSTSASLYAEGQIGERINLCLTEKVEHIESFFNRQKTLDARQNEIRQGIVDLAKVYADREHVLDEQLAPFEVFETALPIQLEARIENGRVVALKQLHDGVMIDAERTSNAKQTDN
jgi:hypothetical protein